MSHHLTGDGRPVLAGGRDPLAAAEAATLRTLLELIVPYPTRPGGPVASDTVAFVQRRLLAEDADWVGPLRAGLAAAAGREAEWLADAATAADGSGALFAQLRSWAWDGLLADPRWGVNRGGLGWQYFGWAGRPRERES